MPKDTTEEVYDIIDKEEGVEEEHDDEVDDE